MPRPRRWFSFWPPGSRSSACAAPRRLSAGFFPGPHAWSRLPGGQRAVGGERRGGLALLAGMDLLALVGGRRRGPGAGTAGAGTALADRAAVPAGDGGAGGVAGFS